MTIEEAKEQTAAHSRLVQLRTQVVNAQDTAALPDGSVTYTIMVVHRQSGTGKESRQQAEITLNSADVAMLLSMEKADLDAAIGAIEATFSTI